ncbi:hypothetical protein MKZ38_004483 [Zalerion maritima]|uniref:Uncharacterized protein n=1 Tax=Zalerion maritima TaxID=339359 RepID=A0AAD5WRL5_9PEZI|nr:hypothetical protein MKZ38_004483 [Zalerion maritima]
MPRSMSPSNIAAPLRALGGASPSISSSDTSASPSSSRSTPPTSLNSSGGGSDDVKKQVVIPSADVFEVDTLADDIVLGHIPNLGALRSKAVRPRDIPQQFVAQATAAELEMNRPFHNLAGNGNFYIASSHGEVENGIRVYLLSRILPTYKEQDEPRHRRLMLQMKLNYLSRLRCEMERKDEVDAITALREKEQAEHTRNDDCSVRVYFGKKERTMVRALPARAREDRTVIPRGRMLALLQGLEKEELLKEQIWCWECKEMHSPFESVRPEGKRRCNETRPPSPVAVGNPLCCLGKGVVRPASPQGYAYPLQTRGTFPMISGLMKAHRTGDADRAQFMARQMSSVDTWTGPEGSRIQLSQRVRILPRISNHSDESAYQEIQILMIPRAHRAGDVATEKRLADLAALAESVLTSGDLICPHHRVSEVVSSAFPAWMEIAEHAPGLAVTEKRLAELRCKGKKQLRPWGKTAECVWRCGNHPCQGLASCGEDRTGLRKIQSCNECWTDWSISGKDLCLPHMDKAQIACLLSNKKNKKPHISEGGLGTHRGPSWLSMGRNHNLEIQPQNTPAHSHLVGRSRALVLTIRKDLGRGFDAESDRRWLATSPTHPFVADEEDEIVPGDVFVGWDTNGLSTSGRAAQIRHDATVEDKNRDRLAVVKKTDRDGRTGCFHHRAQTTDQQGFVSEEQMDDLPWMAEPSGEFVVGDDSDDEE